MSQQFGFPSETTESSSQQRDSVVYNVEQLNSHIRQTLEGQLGQVWLRAEVSNFKPHSSGHFYFSLKDSRAQISAIMFRGHNAKLKFKPHDGLEVIVRGRITVYEPRGTYQIVCETMEPVGAGALQKQFEQLKEKLKSEGLFDSARKRQIPPYPRHVAIVTSPTGAAIQDILNVMRRRARNVELTLVPAIVQGAAAASSLCEAFSQAVKLPVDVIIIGRGGGSMEDLWCFNDEKLARLVAASPIPVISAVGHEIDFTICDFVADLRAPTPSAAAELVAKSSHEILQKLQHLDRMLNTSLQKFLKLKMQSLVLTSRRLVDPKKKLQDYAFRNDELLTRLEQATRVYFLHLKKDIQLLEKKLVSPRDIIQNLRSRVEKMQILMNRSIDHRLNQASYRLKSNMGKLDSLSPLAVVDRGYSITTTGTKVVKSVKDIKKNDEIEIKVTDGVITAEVTGTKSTKG
ncbi:exodeoxyribonuclease VII large subunit [Pseudobdellovibrio exovorus]|uniref:Exodeoxyribonuclease 7 large subunit n=1 Tax=Pseudobdellovibrio exovorus JSS TaxID=1184267 RepID=M4VER8_9BACT|nr:exodeoxyribonuclease VII large subunit [Pseudobdellovibrio exovorus]AGH96521.1 exodeoxyribonuclease VII, large subunit [Pseudobdellovibrio exovorus JSS]